METLEIVKTAVEALRDKKAEDVPLLILQEFPLSPIILLLQTETTRIS